MAVAAARKLIIAATIEEAVGMMELSFPKWDYRKCLEWRVVRGISERGN